MSLGGTQTESLRIEEVGTLPTASGREALHLKLAGRLDASSNEACERRFAELVAAGHHRVILDCGELAFISSMGLGTLIQLVRAVRPHGGGLSICRMSDMVRQTVMLAGLAKILLPEADPAASALRL